MTAAVKQKLEDMALLLVVAVSLPVAVLIFWLWTRRHNEGK